MKNEGRQLFEVADAGMHHNGGADNLDIDSYWCFRVWCGSSVTPFVSTTHTRCGCLDVAVGT